MRASPRKAIRRGSILLALVVLAAGIPALVQSGGEATAAPGVVDTETINLCADEGTIDLPSLAAVPIWGFALDTGTGCAPTLPGPVPAVDVGDTVVVNLRNYLDEPVSIVFPGQDLAPDSVGASPNDGTGLVAAMAATPLSGGSATSAAALTTAFPGDNNDATFTADAVGTGGNSITVEYVDPAIASSPLAVTVLGTAITVSLATDAGSAISSTANDVIAAVNANPLAALLVDAALPWVSYTFTASNAGTFLYEAGTNASVQVPMGLYGALIVRPLTPGQAYDAATAYNVEKVLVLSEIDPNLNTTADPNDFDFVGDPEVFTDGYHPTYFLINGEAYPDTDAIAATTGQDVLLRYVNAGLSHHTMTLLGKHQRVIARDAFATAGNAYDAVAQTVPAGSTLDAIVDLTGVAGGATLPLYNRQLNVTNDGAYPGGMLTFLTVAP